MNMKHKNERPLNICIVGLGLMGASLAMALRGFRQARIIALNRSEKAVQQALSDGIVDEAYSWVQREKAAASAVGSADLTIVCLYAGAAIEFLKTFGRYGKVGSVWTDVTGVKEEFIRRIRPHLRQGVDFVGGHPMAGRECNGYESALPGLYKGCNYILTPQEHNRPESVALLREMAQHIGVARITEATPAEHDDKIAFTSQMAHVLASAIVQNHHLFPSEGFEGNSFGDLTRVAHGINGEMWSELFVLNKRALSNVLLELEAEIRSMREQVEENDVQAIQKTLSSTCDRKAAWEKRHQQRATQPEQKEGADGQGR